MARHGADSADFTPSSYQRTPDRSPAAALHLDVGPAALGFVTWAYAAGRVDVSFVASTLYLTSLCAFVPAWLLLGEHLMPVAVAVAGGAVVISGVAVVTASRRRSGLATGRSPRHRRMTAANSPTQVNGGRKE